MDEGSTVDMGSLACFDDADLLAWTARGRSEGTLDDALRAFLRAQFLRATVGGSFGPDVGRGLAGEESTTALALAVRPASDWEQHRAKRLALRSQASAGALGDLAVAMVLAALRYEERRLTRGATAANPASQRRHRPEPTACERSDPPSLPVPGAKTPAFTRPAGGRPRVALASNAARRGASDAGRARARD